MPIDLMVRPSRANCRLARLIENDDLRVLAHLDSVGMPKPLGRAMTRARECDRVGRDAWGWLLDSPDWGSRRALAWRENNAVVREHNVATRLRPWLGFPWSGC